MRIIYVIVLTLLLSGCLEYSYSSSNDKVMSGPGLAAGLIVRVAAGDDLENTPPRNPYYVDATVQGILQREQGPDATPELRLYPLASIPGTENLEYLLLREADVELKKFGDASELNVTGLVSDDVEGRDNVRFFDSPGVQASHPRIYGKLTKGEEQLLVRFPTLVKGVQVLYSLKGPFPNPFPKYTWNSWQIDIAQLPTVQPEIDSPYYIFQHQELDDGSREYEFYPLTQASFERIKLQYHGLLSMDMLQHRCYGIEAGNALDKALGIQLNLDSNKTIAIYGELFYYKSTTTDPEICGANFFEGLDMGMETYGVKSWKID